MYWFLLQKYPNQTSTNLLSSQEKKQLKTEVYNKILELIKETKHKLILIGDFNSVFNLSIDHFLAKKSRTPENDLLKFFKNNQFYDTYRLFHPQTKSYTYNHKGSQSRIDQIWTNIHITLLDFADIHSHTYLDSDHNIISLELTLIYSQQNSQNHSYRKLFL